MEEIFRLDALIFFCSIFFVVEGNGNYHHMYLGCYIEAAIKAVPDHALNNLPNNTVELCLSHCQSHGARYAAVRRGHRCWCADDGASYDMHGEAPESECDYLCTGDPTQTCGGALRMAVYDSWGIYLAGKAITQSSVGSGGVPERAVDGNPDSDYNNGESCSHTDQNESSPSWWRVDLGEDMCIGRVVIINRDDCCDTRLIDTVVQVGTNLDRHFQCGSPVSATQAAPGARVTIECDPPVCGRYVSIVTGLGVNTGILTMCEVYMFAGVCGRRCPEHIEYTRISEKQCIGTISTTVKTLSARSKIECSRFCLNDVRCRSFDLVEETHHGDGYNCRLQSSETTSGLLDEDGCDFYMESQLANSHKDIT